MLSAEEKVDVGIAVALGIWCIRIALRLRELGKAECCATD